MGSHHLIRKNRCFGRLSYFLPHCLRPDDQPLTPPTGALELVDLVKVDGGVLCEPELKQMFLDMVPPELHKSSPSEPRFSFYKATHRRALKNLVDWVLSLNFLPALTLLVKVWTWA